MNESEFLKELRALDASDPEAVEQLAEKVKTESRQIPKTTVRLWLGNREADGKKAGDIFFELDELVIYPCIEAIDQSLPKQKIQLISLAVDQHLENRQQLLAKLKRMMEDKTQLPLAPSIEPVEQKPRPRRVCDEAYLLVRRLLNFSEDEVDYELNANDFLELSDKEKDNEILKAMNSKTWTNWTEHID